MTAPALDTLATPVASVDEWAATVTEIEAEPSAKALITVVAAP